MKYLTGYYWQGGDLQTSLALQHLVYHKKQIPMLYACICREPDRIGEESFAGLLSAWFQQEGRSLLWCDKGEVLEDTERIFRQVFAELTAQRSRYVQTHRSAATNQGTADKDVFSCCGMFCIDRRFLLFAKGSQKSLLLNSRFERGVCRELLKEKQQEEVTTLCGLLEPEVGILLSTASYAETITQQSLCECLASKELSTEQRLQKRLAELGEEAGCQGVGGQAAILAVTR